jgi:hypothetical protein
MGKHYRRTSALQGLIGTVKDRLGRVSRRIIARLVPYPRGVVGVKGGVASAMSPDSCCDRALGGKRMWEPRTTMRDPTVWAGDRWISLY